MITMAGYSPYADIRPTPTSIISVAPTKSLSAIGSNMRPMSESWSRSRASLPSK